MMHVTFKTLPAGGIGPIEPGFYLMTAAEYHADPCPMPSLSSSVAKVLLEKTPRHAAYEHPRLPPVKPEREETAAMRLGTVTHELMLGKGGGFAVIEAENFRTKEAKAARDAAIAAGKTPVLLHEFDEADAIAEAARLNLAQTAEAAHIFAPGRGHAEVVAIWQEGGIWCRAMFDWWTDDLLEIDDLKVTGSNLSPFEIGRKISDMGYEVSEAFYSRGLAKLLPEVAGRIKFRFVFVESDFPYEVLVVENDATAREMGRRQVEYAIRKWGECLRTNDWPGYPRKIHVATYPAYAETSWLQRELIEEGID